MQHLRLSRIVRLTLFSLFLAGVLTSVNTGARAQEHSSGTSSATNAEAANESQKAAEEDDHAQFKHSWMVQWAAKATGLSLDQVYWLFVLLNFAVIAGAVGYLSKKNLPAAFRNRTASIQQAMQEARKASEEANRRLADIEARLSRLDTEIAGMRTAAETEAVAEEARIKAAAEEDARKIVETAEQEIAAAAKSARRELTAYAANLAVSLAAKQIKVDSATDQALVREFAQELSSKDASGVGTKTGKDRN